VVESEAPIDDAIFEHGSELDAGMRMLIFIASDGEGIDERPLRMMQRLLTTAKELTMADVKHSASTQHELLLLNSDRALAALPKLLPNEKLRRAVFVLVHKIVRTLGALSPTHAQALAHIAGILKLEKESALFASQSGKPVTKKVLAENSIKTEFEPELMPQAGAQENE